MDVVAHGNNKFKPPSYIREVIHGWSIEMEDNKQFVEFYYKEVVL